jgi:hypothetical protein
MVVRKEWNRFLAGDLTNAAGIWAVVMFRAWQDRWLTAAQDRAGEPALGYAKTGRLSV